MINLDPRGCCHDVAINVTAAPTQIALETRPDSCHASETLVHLPTSSKPLSVSRPPSASSGAGGTCSSLAPCQTT